MFSSGWFIREHLSKICQPKRGIPKFGVWLRT
jgi:hypothetical protein